MRLNDLYALITTDQLTETRDFYMRWLGFTVLFEATWFVLLASDGEHPFNLAFMRSDHPSRPPGPETFDGKGMIVTLQVSDAAAEYERLQAAGCPIHYPLHDEPWGQRRFMLRDPAGVLLDVVEQTEPEPGFWNAYLPTESVANQV
jgi:uncharacterized glyoxalase superfamily protein PhnB